MNVKPLAAVALLCGLTLPAAYATQINEIRIDQPSSDNDEYFELKGNPFESLNGLSYLVIGDGAGGSGVVEAVVNLDGQMLDGNGLFVAAEGTFTAGTANLTTNLNFENSDNVTHLLVNGFSGVSGDDLDTDDDGVLDVTPWTSIEDSVALQETIGSGELLYSDTVVGPDGTFVPGHVYNCAGGWEIGTFSPVGETDTPGAANPCPVLVPAINEIRIDQPSSDNDEYFELFGTPGESLDGVSYVVIGDGATGDGTVEFVLDLSGNVFDGNGLFTVAEGTFSLATADLVATLNFENSDNVTHLLATNFTGTAGDDLDTDDDGTIDFSPYDEIISSVALIETVGSGDAVYSTVQVGPSGTFVPAHVFLCDDGWQIGEFDIALNTDTPTAANDCVGGPVDPVVTERTIPEIQSDQAATPFEGEVVKTTGVVTADFQGGDQLRGFYLQDPVGDGNAATSDGIFVFTPSGNDVNVGDEIEIVAEIDEFFELTELKNVQSITITGSGSVTPTPVTLPETVDGELEQYEGMLVEIVSDMTVSQNFFLGRYGQMTLSSPDDLGVAGRLPQPTNLFPASSPEAVAEFAANARRILILDDGQDISGFGDNPNPVPYIGFPPIAIRAGDKVTNLIGVIDYGRINSSSTPARDYRLHPTVAPVFTATNPREAVPQTTNGSLSVASFNVLNYFSTIDTGPDICGTGAQDCRGADSASEFARQEAKIVSALQAMDADIVGLIEIENNGYGTSAAIATLVTALNNAYGSPVYDFVDPGVANLGTDAIAVGFIFKTGIVAPTGTIATLSTGAFDQTLPSGRSRQPLAVSFEEIASGEVFTAVINHFKSKRPPSEVQNNGNDDQGDGQGSWNLRRTEAANDLAAWLATDPTNVEDPDVLILGDLNAYAEEDPLLALDGAGYEDMIQVFNGDAGYSFTFDGMAGSLDHALANDSMAEQVTGVIEWHINTDEPPVIDYNEDFNPAGYYEVNPFRSSDHDPVIVGLELASEPVDSDADGVADQFDLCPDTPAGRAVNADGCSGIQFVDLECEKFFSTSPRRYLRCVLRKAVQAYREGLITRQEARHIYFRAIIRVFFGRSYYYQR